MDKLRHTLQNNWPILSKNVMVLKDKESSQLQINGGQRDIQVNVTPDFGWDVEPIKDIVGTIEI